MNDNYFYISESDKKQVGPMDIGELVSRIEPSTMIWRPGMPDWAPASLVPEVAEMLGGQNSALSAATDPREPMACLYGSPPAEYKKQSQDVNPDQYYPDYKVWAVWSLAFSVLSLLIQLFNVVPLILSVLALVKSSSVNRYCDLGDDINAKRNSNTVKTLLLVALGLMVLSDIIGLIV